MAYFLHVALTVLGTFYDEFTYEFTERRLPLYVAFLHAKWPRNQLTHVPDECSITTTSRKRAFKLLPTHPNNSIVGLFAGGPKQPEAQIPF
jgi:hypothetical protein